MVVVEGRDFRGPSKILVAATGVVRNQDARPARLENNRITLADRWGSEPVLCEGVPVRVELSATADRVRCFALDSSGNRREPVEVVARGGRAWVQLDPRYRTVWYEIDVR
ncbi:MAG: hypothetical protein JW719_05935, partial [Pirellulales bacterium]|nr:hypothetical protein [Pirellulales bacterium]